MALIAGRKVARRTNHVSLDRDRIRTQGTPFPSIDNPRVNTDSRDAEARSHVFRAAIVADKQGASLEEIRQFIELEFPNQIVNA